MTTPQPPAYGRDRREDSMNRRDFLKADTATAVLTATLPVQAKEPPYVK